MARVARVTEQVHARSSLYALALVVLVTAVLSLAQEVLIPLALAVLLSFLLSPLVSRLERWHFHRIPAVATAVLLAFFILGGIGWIVGAQLVDLGSRLPQYRANIERKIDALHSEGGPLADIRKFFDQINHKLANPRSTRSQPDKARSAKKNSPQDSPNDQPESIVFVERSGSAIGYFSQWIPGVITLLATAGAVVLFVFFILLERESLRNRFIRLIGPGRITATTEALNEAGERVSRYLRMQLAINSVYGVAVAVGLYAIGLPNAIVWGVVATLLRYLPYVGPWIGATVPILLSLAVFDSWSYVAMTIGLFIVIELIANHALEPVLYGSTTGVSTIAILVAAIFWTWLWGPVGLVLATPLTVCIAVIGRYVPQLEFLNVLLSDEDVLAPPAHYYQRLVAGDQEEASEIVDKQLASRGAEEVYDSVLLPALAMVEHDGHLGILDSAKQEFVRESIRETVEDVAARELAQHPENGAEAIGGAAAPLSVVCLPARDDADEIAGMMLVQVLGWHGIHAECLSVKQLAGEMLDFVAQHEIIAVYVSAVPPFAVTHARYLCKRIRARFPTVKLVLGLWQDTSAKRPSDRLRAIVADAVVTKLSDARAQLTGRATPLAKEGGPSVGPSRSATR